MDDHQLPGGSYPLACASHLTEHLLFMRLQGRLERTLFSRRRSVVRVGQYLGGDAAAATHQDLYGYQLHLMATSITLVRHQTALIKPYYWWLREAGHRLDNPAALLPIPKTRRGLPRPIPEGSLATAITSAPPRLLPWLLLAGWSGLRAAEIAGLRVDDFFPDDRGNIWVRVRGKGDALRNAPVPAWAWPAIAAGLAGTGAAWRRQRGFGPVTAQHVSQYCCEYLHEIGLPDTLHALRHRVGTLTYEQSQDIRLVQDLLGHADLASTAIYTRINPTRMAREVNALPAVALPRHLHVVDTEEGSA